RRDMKREEKKAVAALSRTGTLREYIGGEEEKKTPRTPPENGVAAELEEMYGTEDAAGKKKKAKRKLTVMDKVRYGILFLCIFGFLTAGYFVFDKLFEYYRGSSLYKGLAELVATPDRFAGEYLTRSLPLAHALTIEDVYNGKSTASLISGRDADAAQRDLIAKISRLKEINPDTAGWITVDNTVINYPVVWNPKRNYYLHRDFYGKTLSGGSIFMDERNAPNVAENRNTVLYGHNMADGSMFASLHDFATASVFYNAQIRVATTDGIYVYKPFSVHHSDAYDNYFETDFPSDRAFESFLAEMNFISMFGTDLELNRNSQIITLSTCVSNTVANNDRFVVHAVLVDVLR
ncbi:MAG: class B sortase, partial [Clostridia bacterium]|nr:class B sortase [Clostridia bacterium]